MGNSLRRAVMLACAAIAFVPATAGADDDADSDASETQPTEDATAEMETTVTTGGSAKPKLPRHRGRSEVTRADFELRLPRSAPDALRYEPGIFVQQTAHGQGSAFIRGLTGQQTLILFDGIRLNNSTYRQGPNQYFFTLDSQTIDSLQVLRGGASTRYGSDALGGVILAIPVEAKLRPPGVTSPVTNQPHLRWRSASADDENGGRAEVNLTFGENVALFIGAGARRVGLLRAGGRISNPADGETPLVPRFDRNGRTQLGTGFDEATADARLLYRPSPAHTFKLAAYLYRQFDAPRTDQCPAAFAPADECLVYENQFRTLVYGAWEAVPATAAIATGRATISWQQQEEKRNLSRPSSRVRSTGHDIVDTLGVTLAARTGSWAPSDWLELNLRYGADTYVDVITSHAWIEFTDTNISVPRSRGQYLDGSTYVYGGAFTQASADLFDRLTVRGGVRFSWIAADAPADDESGTRAARRSWFPVVGNAGLQWRVVDRLSVLFNFDHSFRAPNLDDLTSRQQTGPGFQFENPDLTAERATTLEAGLRLHRPLRIEVWGFHTLLDGAVIKRPMEITDCPPNTPRCNASWTRFMLVNAAATSMIWGVEASIYAPLPWGFVARATAAWTWGDGPNVADRPANPDIPYTERVPLSRIPPLNGTVELLWRHRDGLTIGAALRWAGLQDRLALADIDDARIPTGGTPGFAVVDLRASYRLDNRLLISVAFENILDAAYRTHGSSINGPGRGAVVMIDFGPWWRPGAESDDAGISGHIDQ